MANETAYIVASLEDEKTKELGQIISNESSRAILSLLTKKRATESEIANELKLPLSTVNYNIKQLLKSGLIIVGGTFYSKKGNKVNVYSLAKKLILIAPAGVSLARSKIRSILPTAFIAVGLAGLIKLFYSIKNYMAPIAAEKAAEVLPAVAPEAAPYGMPLPLISTHYALFFLAGALVALGLYLAFSWRRK